MARRDIAADGDAMHDREEAGRAEIGFLRRARIGEQPRDGRAAVQETGGRAGADEGVDPAFGQRRFQRVARADRLHIEAVRQRDGGAFAARAPMDAARVHAILFPQHPAHPKRSGLLVFRDADGAAGQVLGPRDAAIRADVDRVVAEGTRRIDGDADIAAVAARHGEDVARHRKLGDLMRCIAHGDAEQLLRLAGEGRDLETLHLHPSVMDRARAVGEGAGEGEGHSARAMLSGVKGQWRRRTPSASAMPLAMAPITGPMLASPAPSGGASGRAMISTATCGTSEKRRIG